LWCGVLSGARGAAQRGDMRPCCRTPRALLRRATPTNAPGTPRQTINTGSLRWAAATLGAYFYMVLSWGGYSFVINLIPIHALACVVSGRATSRHYVAFAPLVIVGTLLAGGRARALVSVACGRVRRLLRSAVCMRVPMWRVCVAVCRVCRSRSMCAPRGGTRPAFARPSPAPLTPPPPPRSQPASPSWASTPC
jgi:hypothetical protein